MKHPPRSRTPRDRTKRAAKGGTQRTKTGRTGTPVADPGDLEPIVAAMSRVRGVTVEPGWGSGSVALKVNGKIFVMLLESGLVFKLPKARVDELVTAGAGTRFDPRRDGRVMKEWIVLARAEGRGVELAEEACRFVAAQAR